MILVVKKRLGSFLFFRVFRFLSCLSWLTFTFPFMLRSRYKFPTRINLDEILQLAKGGLADVEPDDFVTTTWAEIKK